MKNSWNNSNTLWHGFTHLHNNTKQRNRNSVYLDSTVLSVARLEGSGIDESTLSSREVAILTFLKLIFNVFLPIEKGKLSKYLKFLCNNNLFYINILDYKIKENK